MKAEDQEKIANVLSDALLRLKDVDAIVVAYCTEKTNHYRYWGGRVLCRGLAEEMRDMLQQDSIEAEENPDE